MAINDKQRSAEMLYCNSTREAKAYLHYCLFNQFNPESRHIKKYILRDEFNNLILKVEENDIIMNFHENIYSAIEERFHSNNTKAIKEFIEKIINNKRKIILDEEFFRWIKDSERACYWLWTIINSPLTLWTTAERSNYIHFLRTTCGLLEYRPGVLTNKLRYKYIVDCFDSVYEKIDTKKRMLDELKYLWVDIYKNNGTFKWLNKNNKEQTEWMWSYIQGYEGINSIAKSFPTPLESNKIYLEIYACYDTWNVSKEAKELFRNKASRAWNQICHRSRMEKENRVAINAYVTIGAREKLKELSKKNKMTIGELIESLIEKKYNELK